MKNKGLSEICEFHYGKEGCMIIGKFISALHFLQKNLTIFLKYEKLLSICELTFHFGETYKPILKCVGTK